MSDKCVHHGEHREANCPFCQLIVVSGEKVQLEEKNERFYQWFSKSMSREQVDAMLERMPS